MKKKDLQDLFEAKKYSELVKEIDKANFLHPYLSVLKGMAIQLSDEVDDYALDDAKSIFKDAITSDPDYLEGYIELGWYLYNVEDDPKNAIKEFDLALTKSLNQLKEILKGYYLAKNELQEGQFNLNTFVAKIGEELKSSITEVSDSK